MRLTQSRLATLFSGWVQSNVIISMSVCIARKLYTAELCQFLCMLPTAVVRSCYQAIYM